MEIISFHIVPKYHTHNFTIGHHPWWTNKPLSDEETQDLNHLLKLPNCIGIGECGLDKLKGASKEIQEVVFQQQVAIANQANAPLIMHCVRQYDRAIQIKKMMGNTPWCIHGYRRNWVLAKDILDAGMYVSISPLPYMPESFIDMIKYLPMDRFFIETDSEHSLTIAQRYEKVAEIKKMDIFALQDNMVDNVNTFFKWKNKNLIG
jgi:TatD DNase family protein